MQKLTVSQVVALHRDIADLCPITGVTQYTNGEIEVHWGGGATPARRQAVAELLETWQPPSPPQWTTFFELFLDSDIDRRLQETSNQRAYYRLQIAFSDRDNMHVEGVCRYWQATVYGMETPFTAEEIAQINAVAEMCYLPFRVDSDGSLLPH